MKLVTDGKATVTHDMLTSRETIIPVTDVANSIYKLNSETAGVCESLHLEYRFVQQYSLTRLSQIVCFILPSEWPSWATRLERKTPSSR